MMQHERVGIEFHDDPLGGIRKHQLFRVRKAASICDLSSQYIDAATLKAVTDSNRNVLIHEVSDRVSH